MSLWAIKRKAFYASIIIGFFALLAVVPIFRYLNRPQTCFDDIQNQNELGRDCGGVCALQCNSQIIQPRALWARAFEVSTGVYNVVALVENKNVAAGTEEIEYTFSLYDARNILIAEQKGTTFLLPGQVTFPLFSGGIQTANKVASRAQFEFRGMPVWVRMESEGKLLVVSDTVLSRQSEQPRITAVVNNLTPHTIDEIDVIAMVYDENDNVIATSRTILEPLPKNESKNVVFTWPTPFKSPPNRIDVVPRGRIHN